MASGSPGVTYRLTVQQDSSGNLRTYRTGVLDDTGKVVKETEVRGVRSRSERKPKTKKRRLKTKATLRRGTQLNYSTVRR